MSLHEWLNVKQSADRARVCEATIRREIKAGRIRAARVGGRRSWRLRADWIDQWLETSAKPVIESSTR
jgi:excisionase family DNA binding protein